MIPQEALLPGLLERAVPVVAGAPEVELLFELHARDPAIAFDVSGHIAIDQAEHLVGDAVEAEELIWKECRDALLEDRYVLWPRCDHGRVDV